MKFIEYTLENSTKESLQALQKVQSLYGLIPNLFSYMAEAPESIHAYIYLNDVIKASSLSAQEQQIALFTVSHLNGCSFCTGAHRFMGKKAGLNNGIFNAIQNEELLEEPKFNALVTYVTQSFEQRGKLSGPQLEAFLQAGFTKKNIFEINLIFAIKTLSNYSNHLTQPSLNPEFE